MQHFAGNRLSLGITGAVATLTLDHPGRHNAVSAAMWAALPDALACAAASRETKVLVLRGAGGDFAAGADISEFDTVFADRQATLHYARTMAAATTALANFGRPTIARIDGHCVGAGVAIALACDLRIAASDGTFAVTPARLGLIYSLADTRRLMRAVGSAAAKDLLFTSRRIDAAAALALRLIGEVSAPASLDALIAERVGAMASASQWSIRQAKCIATQIENGLQDDTDETRGWFADAAAGDDFKEGLEAFRARRTPDFPWR